MSKEAVQFAGVGIYPVSIAADVPADLLARYFGKTEEGYRISRSIRDQVVFAPHNILKDPPFTRMDLVSCRNLLIYLQAPTQRKVLSHFHFALRRAGYLFLGPSETVGEHQNAFEPVNSKARIFQKQSAATIALSEMIPTGVTFAPIRELTPRDISSRNGGLRMEVKLREAIHSKLISRFAPTCFVVDERNEILYTFGKPQALISLGTGQANLNLLKLAPRDLSLAIATALRKSRKENAMVRYQGIKVRHDQATSLVDLKAEPMSLGHNATAVTLIFLEEAESLQTPSPSEGDEFDQSKRSTERIGELEEEIDALREELRSSVEERETSAEELQATNEELIASNEELQSSNEQLESINEELTTLNSEYLLKNDELLVAHNDIDNFLRTSQIGTILLDESLRIRRFTPLVAAEMHLLPQDTGRALRDLSHPLIGDLTCEAERVLRAGAPVEKTVEIRPGVWYLLRVSPYQREGASDLGIVVTFVNVSVLKQGPPGNGTTE